MSAALGDGVVAAYPQFLYSDRNKMLEPASAANVLTVGSLAHTNGLGSEDGDLVGVRPLTRAGQPSPFTRIGPGIGQMFKPDLVDYGGTAVFDGPTQLLLDGGRRASAGVLTLHHLYLDRLFTFKSGTSFAAPLVAYKAALIREAFPDASANFVRAVLALAAEVPTEAQECLAEYDDDQKRAVVGYGIANVDNALTSEDNRVILFAEDELQVDHFAVYEVPIPKEFQTTQGVRQIKIALAFDPPTRHSRLDYAGLGMGFRLICGASQEEVFDAFRSWEKKKEGDPFKLADKLKCHVEPGPQRRERGTLQCGAFVAKRSLADYGDRYFLAVRCEGGWASDQVAKQRFAVAVELRHQAEIQLHEMLRLRVRV
jgi:hypothetical protein